MHTCLIAQVLGLVAAILALGMAVPALLGIVWGEMHAARALVAGVATAGLLSAVFARIGGLQRRNESILHREAFLVVALAWLLAGILGGIPFWASGYFGGFTGSMFESFSGFTTTGATILGDIESVPGSILLWRSTTQWIGGGGIVLLGVAILPLLGVGGMELYRAEVPGPTTSKLQPRIRETARLLWRAYLLLTGAQIILLIIAGVGIFDAVNHAFTTVSTGGFSTRNMSIADFDDQIIEGIFILFMLLAGTSFSLHFAAFTKGGLGSYFRDSEFRVYLGIILLASCSIAAALWLNGIYGYGGSVRYALFQVVSIITSTGFANADYELWRGVHALPAFTLLVLMLSGGTSGSTAGGVKVVRVWLFLKICVQDLFRQIHPRSVMQLRLGGKVVATDVQRGLIMFLLMYALIFVVGSFLLSMLGMNYVCATSATISALSNIGPALGTLGPFDNYAHIPIAGKWLLILMMVVGRLEIYTVLVLFMPEFWRK